MSSRITDQIFLLIFGSAFLAVLIGLIGMSTSKKEQSPGYFPDLGIGGMGLGLITTGIFVLIETFLFQFTDGTPHALPEGLHTLHWLLLAIMGVCFFGAFFNQKKPDRLGVLFFLYLLVGISIFVSAFAI